MDVSACVWIFVFLNLLEAHADGLGEFFLRDALGKARGPHPAADVIAIPSADTKRGRAVKRDHPAE